MSPMNGYFKTIFKVQLYQSKGLKKEHYKVSSPVSLMSGYLKTIFWAQLYRLLTTQYPGRCAELFTRVTNNSKQFRAFQDNLQSIALPIQRILSREKSTATVPSLFTSVMTECPNISRHLPSINLWTQRDLCPRRPKQ